MDAMKSTKRLEILEESLKKKQQIFDNRLLNHFNCVKQSTEIPIRTISSICSNPKSDASTLLSSSTARRLSPMNSRSGDAGRIEPSLCGTMHHGQRFTHPRVRKP